MSKMTMTLEEIAATSPWVDYRSAISDTLLITFSSVQTQRGKFTPYVAVNDLPFCILRVNCPDSIWYIGGIPETDQMPGMLCRVINDFIHRMGFRKVVMFGGSKGGFGALDIGLRIRSDIIISTGAETVFGHPEGYAVNYVAPRRIDRANNNIANWPAARQSRPRTLHLLFGVNTKIDHLFAAQAKHLLGVEPVFLADCEHSVPQFVAKHYSLSKMIANLACSGQDAFLQAHRI
jgi:hypothetical protein